mmetsp:Transcript_1622/g.4727  ORF Transcript_1622/g.4727 Transcript_1622/m.4727 type:complete len:304 (-) Transcript_1622:1639-2550(-)
MRASRMRSGTNLPRTWPSPPWRMSVGTTVPTVPLRGTSWPVSTRPLRPTIRRPPRATSARPLPPPPPQLLTLPFAKVGRTRTDRSSKPPAGEGQPPAPPPDPVRSTPPSSTIASLARTQGVGPALPAPPDPPPTTTAIGQGRRMPKPPRLVWPLLVVPPRSGQPSPPEGPTQLPPRPEGAVPAPSGVVRSTASIRGSLPSRTVPPLPAPQAVAAAVSILSRRMMDTATALQTRSRNPRWTRLGWTRRDSTRATEPRLSRSPRTAPRSFPMSSTALMREVWRTGVLLWTMASLTTKRVLPSLWL